MAKATVTMSVQASPTDGIRVLAIPEENGTIAQIASIELSRPQAERLREAIDRALRGDLEVAPWALEMVVP